MASPNPTTEVMNEIKETIEKLHSILENRSVEISFTALSSVMAAVLSLIHRLEGEHLEEYFALLSERIYALREIIKTGEEKTH